MFSPSCTIAVIGLGGTDKYFEYDSDMCCCCYCCCCSAAVCMHSVVVADSREGKTYWTDDVAQWAGEQREP